MTHKLAIISFLLLSPTLFGQKYRDLFVHVDSSQLGKTDRFYLEVTLVKKRGKQVTINKTSSKRDWNKLEVDFQGLRNIDKGIASYKMYDAHRGANECEIIVREPKSGIQKTIRFKLPYIRQIHFQTEQLIANRSNNTTFELEFSNGRRLKSSDCFMNWLPFQVNIGGHAVEGNSYQLTPRLKDPIADQAPKFVIQRKSDSEILCEKQLFLAYPSSNNFNFNGDHGSDGVNGKNGSSPSGDATNATSGTNGEDAASCKLLIYEVSVNDMSYLLLRGILKNGHQFYDVLDARNPNIVIEAIGGNGGNGGSGGIGGDGQIDKENDIESPKGGKGGHAGSGGNAGRGGDIYVYFHEPSYERFNQVVTVFNHAGTAGFAGTAGKGGRGDHTESKLLGKILSVKDGADGNPGTPGTVAPDGKSEILKVSDEEFQGLLIQYEEGNFRF
ncbi:MAG: hypothetical protein EP338_01425 [Bacteroidetes bacterium]|nr:MAG: hypothetical protein EP338_01425 [Bacteroidota bacterium]